MANDERPKLSWREIDKARDGSGRPGRAGPSSGRPAGSSVEDQRQKQYRAALEAAFAKGEMGKLAEKLNVVRGLSPESGAEPKPAPVPAVSSSASPSGTVVPTSGPAPEAGEAAAGEEGGARGKKKPGEDKPSLLRKFLEASSQKEISRCAERYLARFPLPDDHEFLEQLLEHEKEARVREALGRIGELLDRRHLPKRTRALTGKLRYLTETSSNDELRELAGVLLKRIV